MVRNEREGTSPFIVLPLALESLPRSDGICSPGKPECCSFNVQYLTKLIGGSKIRRLSLPSLPAPLGILVEQIGVEE